MSYNLQEDNPLISFGPQCFRTVSAQMSEQNHYWSTVPFCFFKFCLMVLSLSLSFELLGSPQLLLRCHLPDPDRFLKHQCCFWMLPCLLGLLLSHCLWAGLLAWCPPSLAPEYAHEFPSDSIPRAPSSIHAIRITKCGAQDDMAWTYTPECIGNHCHTHLGPQVSSTFKSKAHFVDRMLFLKPYLYFVPSLLHIPMISHFIGNGLSFIVGWCLYVAKCLVPSTHLLRINSSHWLRGARPGRLPSSGTVLIYRRAAGTDPWSQLLAQECGLLIQCMQTDPISKANEIWKGETLETESHKG